MRRLILILVFLAACWMVTPAPAGTITVLGTSAFVATMTCNKTAPLFAQCSESAPAGTATAVADVLAGHLGGLVGATAPGYVTSLAQASIGFALNDMTSDDFLQIDMSLHGSFTNAYGNGASVSLTIEDGDSIIGVPSIGCNFYNVQNYGVPCSPGGGALRATIPLDNLDNLYLTWLLQPAVGTPPAFSDFLNSADFTITVPTGTNLVNNPGGTLFQTQGPTGVPEPNTGLLVGSGLILVLLLGKNTATMRRLIVILAIAKAACLGQILGDASALNAGNLAGAYQTNYGVAPGSRFAILGSALGSDASQESFPLATQLGEVSVKVTVGNFTADCWLLSTRADRLIALLPSATPVGDGTVTLTRGPLLATTKIHVIPVALGLLARNQSELGPAFAFHDNQNPITLLDSAVSGENITIRGTGLGAVGGDEGAGPAPSDLNVPLDVRVGGAVATVLSARRSGTLAGVDEIVFQVPPGIQSCYVPVAIRAAGAVSNYVTLPVHDGGGACSDSFGFTSDALANLPSGRDARIGVIPLTRVGLSNAGITDLTDSGHMYFSSYSPEQLISRRGLTVATTPGACVVASITSQSGDTSVDPVAGSGLSVGQVTISGPKGAKVIDPSQAGKLGEAVLLPIQGLPPGISLPPQGDLFLDPGSYTITATASPDVGAFSVSFQLPAAVEWSNQPSALAALSLMIPRDQDFLVQWKNGNDPDLVIITGFGLASDFTGAEFICTERASKGSFSVPAFVLSSIPATLSSSASTLAGIGGGLSVGSVSGNPGRFTADQLDLGYVTFSTTSFIGIGGWR